MKKPLLLLSLILFCFSFASATDGYRIDIQVDNYDQDTLVAGYYFGKQTLVLDTLLKNDEGGFMLEDDESLDAGVYLLLLKPDNQFVQFLVDDKEQQFSISFDATNLIDVDIEGSSENTLFNDYMKFLREKRELRQPLVEQRDNEATPESEKEALSYKIEELDQQVSIEQDRIIVENPSSITSLMIKANKPIDTPEFEGTEEEVHQQKYLHYRAHYFDNIEIENPISVRTPFFNDRIDYFLKKLTYQVPDSINKSIDHLLESMMPAEKTYQYYLSQMINEYAASKIVGHDAVYVHIAENYYGAGKAPWVDSVNVNKIVGDALKLKPTLIGMPAPDFTAYNYDGDTISLASIDADYRVLFFWKPDCSFCTKAVPIVKEFYKNYKDKGVEIVSICTKLGKDYNKCWEGIEEKGMGEFINLGDQYQRSKILKNYNAVQTPKFFIIDRDDTIIMKGIGAAQLDEVMDEMLARAATRSAE